MTRFSVVHDTRTRSRIVRDNYKKNRSSIHGRISYSFFSTTNRSHYGKHAICVFVREQNRRRREQQRKHESRFIPFVNGNGRFSILFFLFFSTSKTIRPAAAEKGKLYNMRRTYAGTSRECNSYGNGFRSLRRRPVVPADTSDDERTLYRMFELRAEQKSRSKQTTIIIIIIPYGLGG